MGVGGRRTELFSLLMRLRRAERAHPEDRDIVLVRVGIERELGAVFPRAVVARMLGVHHSSLQRWVDSGDVPVVLAPSGQRGVPIDFVAALIEQLESDPKTSVSARPHRLEAVFAEQRRQAAELDVEGLLGDQPEMLIDPHERATRRALAYHRTVARKLRGPDVDAARHRIWQWQDEGRIDDPYAERWLEILDSRLPELRRRLGDDSAEMRDLRQNSPFAGVLSEAERWKIWHDVR